VDAYLTRGVITNLETWIQCWVMKN